jgi:hypothetical protein
MADDAELPASEEAPPEIVRNNDEVEALVREFEAAHVAFMDTEPMHRDVQAYHKMRLKFAADLRDAVARQHAPGESTGDETSAAMASRRGRVG